MIKLLMTVDSELSEILQLIAIRKSHFEVRSTTSGTELMALAHSFEPEILIVGQTLSDMGAAECCRQIKADASLSRIPVLLVGAESDWAGCRDALEDGRIARPFSVNEINRTLLRHLEFIERAVARRNASLRIDYYGDGVEGVGYTSDVCRDGLFLRLQEPIAEHEQLQLIFQLPQGNRPTIRALGEVVRTVAPGADPFRPSGVGIRLSRISGRDRQELSSFVNDIPTGDDE
jgi:CheY-like chemotaxis protein